MARQRSSKSRTTAYLLWALGLGGLLGLHRFYLGDRRHGLLELCTLGGLGALAARDLLAMDRLVDRANGLRAVAAPTAWARPSWRGRWLPIMWRGRLVAAAVALSIVLTVLAGWSLAVSVLLTWALGWWTFSVGVFLGSRLLPLTAPVLVTWHYRLSGRAPGEPLARLEAHPRETVRVDPVPDEAFLPLAAAIAIAFELVEWGPAVPLPAGAYELGLPLVAGLAGIVLPLFRAPPGMGLRSVRRDDRGQVSSKRPVGQRMALYLGMTFVLGALLQAYLSRDAGVFTLVFSLVVPILLATAWYEHDRLARDVGRIEDAVRRRAELSGEGGEGRGRGSRDPVALHLGQALQEILVPPHGRLEDASRLRVQGVLLIGLLLGVLSSVLVCHRRRHQVLFLQVLSDPDTDAVIGNPPRIPSVPAVAGSWNGYKTRAA